MRGGEGRGQIQISPIAYLQSNERQDDVMEILKDEVEFWSCDCIVKEML